MPLEHRIVYFPGITVIDETSFLVGFLCVNGGAVACTTVPHALVHIQFQIFGNDYPSSHLMPSCSERRFGTGPLRTPSRGSPRTWCLWPRSRPAPLRGSTPDKIHTCLKVKWSRRPEYLSRQDKRQWKRDAADCPRMLSRRKSYILEYKGLYAGARCFLGDH
jgi:hypothetical protein